MPRWIRGIISSFTKQCKCITADFYRKWCTFIIKIRPVPIHSTLLTGYIKCGMDRDRPDFDYEGTPFPVKISRDTFALFCEGGYDASYPSGHAARAIILDRKRT